MKRMTFAVLICLLASMALWAQEKKAEKKGDMKHDHAAMEKKEGPPSMNAKPSAEMTKLIKLFAGTWTADEKIEPGPMAPKGATGTGKAVFKPGPGGLSLIEEYDSPHGPMGSFHGHGVTWWDDKAGEFKGTWCDTMMTTCMLNSMKWQGDKLVAAPYPMEQGGQKIVMTSAYTDIKPDAITFEMGSGPTAEQAKKEMTIVYKRAGKAATPAAKKEGAPAKK